VIILPICLLSGGSGLAATAATTVLMKETAVSLAGSTAALNEVATELGETYGIAVLGGILAASYRAALPPSFNLLPLWAQQSLSGTIQFAKQLGDANMQAQAIALFFRAMKVTAFAAAAILLVGIVLVCIFLPSSKRTESQEPSEQSIQPKSKKKNRI
jgi:DHA2 family multidrug resistance protein-like MFS transporter